MTDQIDVTFEGGPLDGRTLKVDPSVSTYRALLPRVPQTRPYRKPRPLNMQEAASESYVEYKIVQRWRGVSSYWVGVLV
jgi:hypothetical protein